jgi:hypothetical protein
MATVALALSRLLFDRVNSHYCEKARALAETQNEVNATFNTDQPFDDKREVNPFIGWSLHKLITEYRDIVARQGNGDTDVEQGDDEEGEAALHLELLLSMRCLHADAIIDDEYLRDCYSPHMRMENCGGLALVSKEYFGVASQVMRVIKDALTTGHFEQEEEPLQEARKRVAAGLLSIEPIFVLLTSTFDELSEDARVALLRRLAHRASNARFGVVIRNVQSNTMKRGGDKCQDESLRGGLKKFGPKTKPAPS